MACLLQPECNFLHRYFRCKLPVEVVDMEVKITSMQGMHIFRRDRTTQLVRCVPWTPNLCPHPNMVKKMRTFLEVENKMGPIIPAQANQYRLPLPETNPNVRKGNATKKRRTVTPKRKFRPVAPKADSNTLTKNPTKTHQQCSSSINAHDGKTRHSMAWHRHHVRQSVPGQELVASKRLFATEKKEEMAKPYPKEEDKMEEQDPKEEKCGWGPGCPLCQAQKKEANPPHQQEPMENQQQQKPLPKLQAIRPDTLNMTKTKQQWEQEMERLNEKYKLDTFSDSELDSESDEDE